MSFDTAELLASLTARGSWEPLPSGNGPTWRLAVRPSDVAAALGRVTPSYWADLLLVVFCDHPLRDLHRQLVGPVRDTLPLSFPASVTDDRVAVLVRIAIDELRLPLICPHCNGEGVRRAPPRGTCAPCEGSGNLTRRQGSRRARALGVAKSTWSAHWAGRHQAVFRLLNCWVSEAFYQIKRQLNG